ncbi:MAG TPA: ATP-dependent DNA ligase [Solirubrobacteraceae bacterium]|nr:ATP-dependent DNA ligase [Solirubrobacteraceae bacterium]
MQFGIEPQLAKAAKELPLGDEWAYEQKYDGFRAIAFVDADGLRLQSRTGNDLTRYFPELSLPAGRYVLDGEIVVDGDGETQAFGSLQLRLHPAASRIERLSAELPASYVAFDLLELDGLELLAEPFGRRREALEKLGGVRRSELVRDPAEAERWLDATEGVVAKRLDAAYAPGKRTAMVKVKRLRTLDCVVMGYRPGIEPETVGSIILGLYESGGTLRPIGHSSAFSAKRKRELRTELAALETGARGSGEASRWTADRELEWVELRPELVVEVSYDHVSDGRIRHGTKIVRWREDKPPRECTIDQLH